MRAAPLSASMVLLASALVSRGAAAAPSVWMVDDGEKIRRDAVSTPFESGAENPVWRPGQPARLFAMRNESVALQVVVETDGDGLDGVTVELAELEGPDGASIKEDTTSLVGRPIERFVEHFVEGQRSFGAGKGGEVRGWEPGSGPPDGEWAGPVPDALFPVALAPSWSPYPLVIEPRSNGIVWIDVNVPRAQAAGMYRGDVVVKARGEELARLPVELDVVEATLPDHTVATALDYDHEELEQRVGPRAERQLWQLLHAHRIAPLDAADTPDDVSRVTPSLSGSLYTRAQGYVGPAPGMGDGVLAIGAHGAFGGPDDVAERHVQAVADRIADFKLLGATDVFLYAADDQCSSPWGAGWRALLRHADDENLRRVRVGWTCTQDPTAQPVDVPMMRGSFDPAEVKEARAQGKESWVVDGVRPRTGTFLVDDDAVSPRVNGWLSAMFRIPRWVSRESSRWYTEAGDVPVDPFEHAGWMLYPGTQRDAFGEHSAGTEGVLPSIRLKNWRRGVEDAGYLQMARERDPARADAVARWLVPAAFNEATTGEAPSWGSRGKPFFEARRALLAIVLGEPPVALPARAPEPPRSFVGAAATGCSHGMTEAGGGIALGFVVGAVGLARMRRRREQVKVPDLHI